ncbi:GNAT family N-acetyltransferase [Gracilaria domingensis]|nr:GNAT family N-acetyltransferase [Gracilaria domingensis]
MAPASNITPPGDRVRSDMQWRDIPQLASTLASAFEDDPFFRYLHGSNVTELFKRNKIFFSALLRTELRVVPQHSVINVSQDKGCVAIWNHVGKWDVPETVDVLVAMFRTFGWRTFHVASTMNKLKQSHPARPHVFLSLLGTQKEKQGKGNGSAVISPMLRQCDRDGTAVYLESSNRNNIPFYERHGFKVVGDIRGLPEDCPPIIGMWRDPQ